MATDPMGEPEDAPGDEFPVESPPTRPRAAKGRCAFHPAAVASARCADCERPVCIACRSALSDGEDRWVCPPCAPGAAVTPSVPFEDPALDAWTGFWRTWRLAWTKPPALFRAFPERPIGRAIVFAYLAALPAAALLCGWEAVKQKLGLERPDSDVEAAFTVAAPLAALVLAPMLAFFQAVLVHFPALLFGARWGFGTTFRIVCFVAPLELSKLLPVCGGVLYLVLSISLVFHGLRRVHGLSIGGALVSALVPVVTVVLLAIGVAMLAFTFAMGGWGFGGRRAIGVGGAAPAPAPTWTGPGLRNPAPDPDADASGEDDPGDEEMEPEGDEGGGG